MSVPMCQVESSIQKQGSQVTPELRDLCIELALCHPSGAQNLGGGF